MSKRENWLASYKQDKQEYNAEPMTTMIDKSILQSHLFIFIQKTFTYDTLFGTFYDRESDRHTEREREIERVSES